MRTNTLWLFLALFIYISPLQGQQVQLVNMIPNAQSNEQNQDSEPNLAINPANANQMVGTAFTSNPLGATTPPSAPIFVSTNGGVSWLLNTNVPSNIRTGDITVKFGATSNMLYGGILRRPAVTGFNTTMDILRTNNFLSPTLMQLQTTRNRPDQPYIEATTIQTGAAIGSDRVYVGNNDLGAPSGRTAAIDQSLNGEITAAVYNRVILETRTTASQNMPPIRTAIHSDGTIYSAFERATTITPVSGGVWNIISDIIVVRDDNWGTGASPFTALVDPGDILAGRRVMIGRNYTFSLLASLGQERGGSKLSIAVDPNNSNIVYIAWSDNTPTGGTTYNLHVRRSIDRGLNWSATDLRQITNASNPALAINSLGELAFSYQQLVSGNWRTIIERTTNDFTTIATSTLHTFPDGNPAPTFFPYLGDYTYLTAKPFGKDFCGVFSASNNPTPTNFPTVQPTWQRNVDMATNQLRNLTNTANIGVSIDPYFFRITPINLNQDFYVRDWTNTPASHDLGEEPSDINFWFNFNSDVWTRRSNTPGTFNANDQPDNQNPQPVGMGNNFAYVRVHRKLIGTAETVSMLFLKSEFGTGSNFQLINGVSSFSTLSFSPTDLNATMTTGVQWDLIDPNAVTADHPCMAIEISTPTDRPANPTLLGRAPGWAIGTDLMVISDNNKAQRNLHVYTGGPGGSASDMLMYANIHNASLFNRDVQIITPIPKDVLDLKPQITVRSGNKESRAIFRGDTLILSGMKPCENRWIELSVKIPSNFGKATKTLQFKEMVGSMAINGFGIGIKAGSQAAFEWENLEYHNTAFYRLLKEFQLEGASEQSDATRDLLQKKPDEAVYQLFLESYGTKATTLVSKWLVKIGQDPFDLTATTKLLLGHIKSRKWQEAAIAHANFTHKLNAFLSYLHKSNGDVADIIQTLRWQNDQLQRAQVFRGSDTVLKAITEAKQFIEDYSKVKLMNKDYPYFVKENLPIWQEITRKYFPNDNFAPLYDDIKAHLDNPQQLQKSHCGLVAKLASLTRL